MASSPRSKKPSADAVNGKYHFLDVGATPYGDCIVVDFGSVRVLIDGSHEKDFTGQAGYDSVPEQLQAIFENEKPPFKFTLLVVTHCHHDHIGALPALVSNNIIEAKWALVTDPRLGFGRTADDADSVDLANERTQSVAAALREEDASMLSDAELSQFIDTVATVESKYAAMIKELGKQGVKVIPYRGDPLPAELIADTRAAHMSLLGPSDAQLLFAAKQIATTNKDAADAVQDALQQDAAQSDVDLYRRIVAGDPSADFTNTRGNGMNCQSITLAFGPPEARALLAGDMQFAEPGVEGADEEVQKLLELVKSSGPFKLFKTTHHTSHNGQNPDILTDLGDPPIIVHSGGLHDATHPWPATLAQIKQRAGTIAFARTDRNGLISVEPHLPYKQAVTVTKGRLNDFTPNVSAKAAAEDEIESVSSSSRTAGLRTRTTPRVIIVDLPQGPIDMSVGGVDIVVRSGSGPTGLPRGRPPSPDALTPSAGKRSSVSGATPEVHLAGGRDLPRLLFVTDAKRLAANIGVSEAQAALAAMQGGAHAFCDVSNSAKSAIEQVQSLLVADKNLNGVVIAGGYDVIPSRVTDVLPANLRQSLGASGVGTDNDEFYVWSDEAYGDRDGDDIAELPVSRIPDARDSALFLTALQAGAVSPAERFGVRNIARPFADAIWGEITGTRAVNISEQFLYSAVQPAHAVAPLHYFMLHGNDADGTYFAGDLKAGRGNTLAFRIDKVPGKFSGVVFSGCCWGALTVSQKAVDAQGIQPSPRVAERSIALKYLKSGANAFVGSTGAHYSGPDIDPTINYAAPFHEAFWSALPRLRFSASATLFGARAYYSKLIGASAGRLADLDLARRLKNRAQFTCLGLGW
jgi:beta-lactamase superfamily II metal-dependent hydrolase